MSRNAFQKQRGISLPEIMLGLIILGVGITVVFGTMRQLTDISKRQQFQLQEQFWKNTLAKIQKDYFANVVHKNRGRRILNGRPSLAPVAVNQNPCGSEINGAMLRNLLIVAGASDENAVNPWGGPWCLRVGGLVTLSIRNVEVKARPLAVLSAGQDGTFDTDISVPFTTQCPNSANSDSPHICDFGVAAAREGVEETIQIFDRIVQKFTDFSRAQANKDGGGIFTDYFLNDTDPSICSANTTGLRAYSGAPAPNPFNPHNGKLADILSEVYNGPYSGTKPTVRDVLGISENEVNDGFGTSIYFSNRDCTTIRHPYSRNEIMREPPFNATIYSRMPGGRLYQRYFNSEI